MLTDSAHIQQSELKRPAKLYRKKEKIGPLYTQKDVRECLSQATTVEYDFQLKPHPFVQCRFRDAGHILGSAIIEVWITEGGSTKKLVFTGDLGQPGRPILRDPTPIDEADILVMESTYGNRIHKDMLSMEEDMIAIVEKTLFKRGGNVIIPAFAVGRTQQILYHLHRLTCEGRLQQTNIFVDSPMATEATRITREHIEIFDEQAKGLARWHANSKDIPYLYFTATVEESKALNRIHSGAIIISASGMCDAGRIRHHLLHNLPRRECSVLISGFQARGTLGRQLEKGADKVRILGKEVPVRASIHSVEGLSAHADQGALLKWASLFHKAPHHTFVVHGEIEAALPLAKALEQRYGWSTSIPEYGHAVTWA